MPVVVAGSVDGTGPQMIVIVLSIVSFIGLMWAGLLIRRVHDWPLRLLAITLGVMPLYQTFAACAELGMLTPTAATRIKSLVDLSVNVLFLVSIFVLEFAIDERNKTQVQLRVLEQPLPPDARQSKLSPAPSSSPTV